MSLILDALNRTREDKDSVPNLTTQHAVTKMVSVKRQYLPWLILSVAVVAIVWLMLGLSFADSGSGSDTGADAGASVVSVSETTSAANQSESALDKEGAAEALPVRPVAEVRESEAVVDTFFDKSPASDLAALAVETEIELPPLVDENPAVAELYQNRDLVDDTVIPKQTSSAALDLYTNSSVEEPIDLTAVLQSAREEIKNASLDEHPVPLLATMSQQTKDGIPTLYYQRHDYSSNVAISTVVLNGKPLQVGGSLGQGIKVEEILPDSVVLSYQGTQFRLRALNSWVNL